MKEPLLLDEQSPKAKHNTLMQIASVLAFLLIIILPLILVLHDSDNTNDDDSSNDDYVSPYPEIVPIFPVNWTVTGIRQDINNNVIITGAQSTNPVGSIPGAFVYYGPLSDFPMEKSSPSLHYFIPHFPNETVTIASFYGPNSYLYDDTLGEGNIRAVGGYSYSEVFGQWAFYYEGPLDGSGVYKKIIIPPMTINVTLSNGTVVQKSYAVTESIAHSVMGPI